MIFNSFKLFFKGVRYLLFLKINRIPVFYGYEITSIEGKGKGNALTGTIKKMGGNDSKCFEVDCICLGYGFNSSNNMLRFLGCKHDYQSDSNSLVTFRHDDFQTSVKDIYAIGDCVQINGAQVAQLEGTLSGYNVADSLSYDINSEYLEDKNTCESKLRKLKTFQVNLWKLYKSNDNNLSFLDKDVEICRCEGIKYSTLENVLQSGPNYEEKYYETTLYANDDDPNYQGRRFEIYEYWGTMDAKFAEEIGIEAPREVLLADSEIP